MTNPFYDPFRVLTRVYQGAHLKIALAEEPIEELYRARTVRTVYGVLENDGYLSLCIKTFAEKSPKNAVRTILKIALYWLVFLEKPKYMVTDTAVELLKKMGKGGTAGFVNAFLRNFDAAQVKIPEGDAGLAIRSNFPLFAVKKIKEQYGERAERILLARSRGVTVRFVQGAEEYLTRPHEQTPFENVYIFPNFARDAGFDCGDYTFQSVGSIAICGVVEPCETLLDACAAPGGKSVLLAEKCGKITACELHEHRVNLIESYVRRMGIENVTAVCADSTLLNATYENAFDGVLCDVPCSGLGTAAENPDLPLRRTEEDLKEIGKVQRSILNTCSKYVKAGGCLYYSTCSILEEENDEVVNAFLTSHPQFSLEWADSPLSHEKTRYGLQFLPDTAYGAGFYVCKMRRKA